MSPLSSLLRTAASTTAKGAAVTLTSTCVSCYLACKIEVGAHRLVYKFFPEKYANVDYANGLTQGQLNAARNVKIQEQSMSTPVEDNITTLQPIMKKISNLQEEFSSIENLFWKEERIPLTSIREEFVMPSQEIIACSMGC